MQAHAFQERVLGQALARAREPERAVNRDEVGSAVASNIEAGANDAAEGVVDEKRRGGAPVAERLKMGRPASVSKYVRRFRPCRRSESGIVQGSRVTGQCVTPFVPAVAAG